MTERVRLIDPDDEQAIVLGTVRTRSKAGYVQVDWDRGELEPDWFSPNTAATRLQVVNGDDARRRHRWGDFNADLSEGRCLDCGVAQTDDNYWAACPAEAGR